MAAPEALRKPHRLRPAALLLAALLGAGVAAAEGPVPPPPPRPVADLHYGEALFRFFQQEHFSALTGLMAAQQSGRMARQADEAEVLRGGLLLSWGLQGEAEQLFTRMGQQGGGAEARDSAWFHLAKIRYQRGLLAEARAALGRIGAALPAALRHERRLLEAQLLMAAEDHAGAARLLEAAHGRPEAGPRGSAAAYLRYNLAIALIASGDAERGSALLDEIGRAPGEDEESRSLRDMANVALGYTALQQGRPEYALVYLQRVRLHGLHANRALLGFGWAAAAEGSYKQALVPWLELNGRDPSDSAVLEARIAVPSAYAAVGAHGQALQRYQEAIAAFEREAARIDESIAGLRADKLLDALIERNPGEEMGWSWPIERLPEMPHAGHLSQVFARHEFQAAFKNYRDLRFLERRLRDWQDKLGVFGAMLEERRDGLAGRLQRLRAAAAVAGPAALRARRAALAAELAAAEAQADGLAFADARQRGLLARLEAVRAALRAGGADPAYAVVHDRVRRVAGVLSWELARQQPARTSAVRKSLQALDAELAEAGRREAVLARAEREEPARLASFAGRNAELAARIDALLPKLDALAREQQEQVQVLAVAELRRQKERLAVHTAQARFAVAQIYDRASLRGEADHAAPR